jgi:hypothetical protein
VLLSPQLQNLSATPKVKLLAADTKAYQISLYAGDTIKQFISTMNYILGQLVGRFKTWKISDRFKEAWKNDPDNVPDNVGAIIAEDIMTIKMSGPFGDPGRDLEAMVRRYNSGKININTTASTTPFQSLLPRPTTLSLTTTHLTLTTLHAPPIMLLLVLAGTKTPGAGVAAAPLHISSAPRRRKCVLSATRRFTSKVNVGRRVWS